MARENQGLQISLIVFVMLTIILGVTTYLFFRQWDEADTRAKANLANQQKSAKEAADYLRNLDELKRMVGMAKQDVPETVFAEDMKKYAGGYPEVSRFYRPLVEKMQETINQKKDALALAEAKIQKLEEDFRVREANKEPQMKLFEQERDKAKQELASEQEKLNGDRDRINQQNAKLNTDLASTRKAAEASQAASEQKVKEVGKQIDRIRGINTKLSSDVAKLTSEDFEGALGDVRWVNQQTGTVWINLGRADALQRQVTFGVYPADADKMAGGSKKASIEVTKILGDHLAEARISDDKIANPVVPGDKIYTPVWVPNEKRHFALAGAMDIDHDGKDDVLAVKDIITMNGGVVDAYIDQSGKLHGGITPNTRYLVIGETPTEKGAAALHNSFTQIQTEAKFYGVQELQLQDLLQRMGWTNPMHVVAYGTGANAHDFAAKDNEEVQRKSIGQVFDSTKERVPPARIPKDAY